MGKGTLAMAMLAAGAALGGCGAARWSPFLAANEQVALARLNRADISALNDAVDAIARLEYDTARASLANLIQRFEAIGDRDRAAEAMFWLSYCYEKTAHKNQADVFYRRLIRKYPGAPAARQARDRLERLDLKRPKEQTNPGQ